MFMHVRLRFGHILLAICGMRCVMDLAERNALLAGDPCTVLMLGTERRRPSLDPAELALDRAEPGGYRGRLAAELVPAHRIAPDPQSGRLAKEDLLHRRNLRLVAEHRDHHARPALLHLNWRDVRVER